MKIIVYILNHILLTPVCFAVMVILFAAAGAVFMVRRKTMTNPGKTILCVPLALCVPYFLFIVWFVFRAGGGAY